MKRSCALVVGLVAALGSLAWAGAEEAVPKGKIRVLLTFGQGHADMNSKDFFAMFDAMADVQYTKAPMPQSAKMLKPGLGKDYDVLVMYDWFKYSPEDNEAFGELLKQGIGVVSFHANMLSHPGWAEWNQVIGSKWLAAAEEIDGKKCGPTGVTGYTTPLKVAVADKDHPVTRGLAEFTITDESVQRYYVAPDVRVLLTTDNPACESKVAWVKEYGKCRVFYCLFGHAAPAWKNPALSDLLGRAIRWTARQGEEVIPKSAGGQRN